MNQNVDSLILNEPADVEIVVLDVGVDVSPGGIDGGINEGAFAMEIGRNPICYVLGVRDELIDPLRSLVVPIPIIACGD